MTYRLLIEASNPADIALIRSLLDAEGILHFVQGEAFHSARLVVEPARFLVAEDRLCEARQLIGGLHLASGSLASSEREGEEERDE